MWCCFSVQLFVDVWFGLQPLCGATILDFCRQIQLSLVSVRMSFRSQLHQHQLSVASYHIGLSTIDWQTSDFLRTLIVNTVCKWRRKKVESGVGGCGGVHTSGSKRQETIFVVPLYILWLYKHIIVVLVSAFAMISAVWSVSSLLFFYSRCPLRPAICKNGGTTSSRATWSRTRCGLL